MKRQNKLLRFICKKYPDIYNILPIKRFKHVESFFDYKRVYAVYAHAMYGISEHSHDGHEEHISREDDALTLSCLQITSKYKLPIFFISESILDAIIQSNIDMMINWAEMHLPYEGLHFILPRSSKLNYLGDQITNISFARSTEADNILHDSLFREGDIDKSKPRLLIFLMFKNYKGMYIILDRPYTPLRYEATANIEHDLDVFTRRQVMEADVEIINFCFNLLFIMQARPKLIERGKRIGYHKKSKSEMWSPNIIGLKYQTKSLGSNEGIRSVRMHWRMGHFRNQVYGLRSIPLEEREHKIIWIEPCLISGKRKNEEVYLKNER